MAGISFTPFEFGKTYGGGFGSSSFSATRLPGFEEEGFPDKSSSRPTDFYGSAPQAGQLNNSNSSLQAMLDTVNGQQVNGNANLGAAAINRTYNDRMNALRRKYSDFPDMASAEENQLTRDKANALAKNQLEASTAANKARLGMLQSDRDFNAKQNNFNSQMAMANANKINADLEAGRQRNMAKRAYDQSNNFNNFTPMQGDSFNAGSTRRMVSSLPKASFFEKPSSTMASWQKEQNDFWAKPVQPWDPGNNAWAGQPRLIGSN